MSSVAECRDLRHAGRALVGAGLIGALLLHALQLPALGPWVARWPVIGGWPFGFHAWIAELAAHAAVCLGLAIGRWGPRWQRGWQLTSGRGRAALLTAGLLLMQAGLALGFWLTRHQGVDSLGGLRALFWLGGEFRLPALFTTAQAALAAALAWALYRAEGARVWMAASAICAYIGIDELLSLHEAVGLLLQTRLVALDGSQSIALLGGVRVYAWQIVFGPLAMLLGGWLLVAFRARVNAGTLVLLVASALIFLAGAIGFETVQATASATHGNWLVTDAGLRNLLFEESLETMGMTGAVYAFAARLWSASTR